MKVQQGRSLSGNLEDRADVVVVGSGAGGAVVAKILAEAGLEVVVLEEGPYVPGEVYGKYRPTETLRRLGREGGTTAVLARGDTPLITVMAGRAVGGSSILTGGVCYRIPGHIHQRWVEERNLPMLSEKDLEPAFESVEKISHVETVPENMRSLSTVKFVEGATRLGIPMKPLRRNTKDCQGCGRCNFGCPHGAKMSVDVTYLPQAAAHGARIYSDCLVEEVVSLGGRVRGVRGRILGDLQGARPELRGHFYVHAETVVVAAGSLHSPLVLMRSGLRSHALGRHLTLHPGFRVVARFEEELKGWQGALQSAYTDHFESEGITLNGLFVPPNVLAAGMPGVGKSFARRVAQIDRMAVFGGMVHDDSGGRVRRGPGREPLLTYRMSKRNKESMLKGIKVMAECFLAGGAQEVYLPIFGSPPVASSADLHGIIGQGLPARRLECITFHPLGSCRIAADPRDGVVDPWGQTYDLEGLYVADGSVVPSSIGVNSQLPIMAMATRIAWRLRERLGTRTAPKASSRSRLRAPVHAGIEGDSFRDTAVPPTAAKTHA